MCTFGVRARATAPSIYSHPLSPSTTRAPEVGVFLVSSFWVFVVVEGLNGCLDSASASGSGVLIGWETWTEQSRGSANQTVSE